MVWRQSFVPADRSGSYEFIAGAASIGPNWVAVGAGGVLFLSGDNALTWARQSRVRNGAVNFSGVIAAGGRFVAYGKESRPDPAGGYSEKAAIFLSEDLGATWTTVEIDDPAALLTAAALGNTFVVAGENGLVCVSNDAGANWETYHLEDTGSLVSLAAGNGAFVMVGPEGLVLRSADAGQTWEEIFPGGQDWIQGVAFGAGRFVLSGGNNAQAGSSSFDGLVWTPAAGTGAWGTIGYGPSGFLTVGGTYGRQTTTLPVPQLVRPPAVALCSTARGTRLILRASVRNAGFRAQGLPSGLSLNPTSGIVSGKPARAGLYPVFVYAASGGSGGDVRQMLFEISDPQGNSGEPLIWRSVPSGLKGWNFQPVAGAFSGGVFVAVGETTTGQPLAVRSTDGKNWSVGNPPAGTPSKDGWGMLRTVAGNGSVWLAGGADSNLWRSVDAGATWSRLPKLSASAFDLQGLGMHGDTIVAVGKLARLSGGEGAGIFVSADAGLTWTSVDAGGYPALRGVAFSGGWWLAVGERGIILRTQNPAGEWLPADSPTLQTLRAVQGAPAVFLAWGEAGVMLRSADSGATWSQVAAGSGYWPGAIANLDGFFVLSGGEKAAGVSSRDGISWKLPKSAGAYGVVMAGNGGFFSLNGDDVWFVTGPLRPGVLAPDWPDSLVVGHPVALQPYATGNPTSWRIAGLPRGLTFDPGTGWISGIPQKSGLLRLRIQARGKAGVSPVRMVALQIENPPTPAASEE